MTDIYAYYETYDEATRLTQDRLHYGEYHVTLHLLRKYLGEAPLKILDACAGCGIYAAALADLGHQVTAGDLIPAHAAYMRANLPQLDAVYEGSVCDLSRFADESFDAVLNFGALYHLQKEDERDQAVRECLRVLRPGGIFAYTWQSLEAMVLGRLLGIVRSLDAQARLEAYAQLETIRRTHCRDIFYGMTPQQVEALARRYGLSTLTTANTYPAFYPMFREVETLSEEQYAAYLDVLIRTCEEKVCADACMHGLWMGRKGR